MTSNPRRFRVAMVVASLAAAGVVFHETIISRVVYAVEKGELEIGREKLAKVEDISELFRAVAKQIMPAVVTIRTTSVSKQSSDRPGGTNNPRRRQQPNIDPRDIPEQLRPFFEGFGERGFEMPSPSPQQSSGSGVIIDAEKGYVLTNNHVVSEGEDVETRIDVTLPDGRKLVGKVLGTDPKTDLALIQIKPERLHSVPLGSSDKMEVGDWVIAVGAPFGLDQTVTQGIISATGRSNPSIARYGEFLQTDAAINPGNSGGPLVNMRGEVIGINTAIATNGLMSGYMGVGFAIPSNMVKEIQPYLEKGEEVVRGYLGVQIKALDDFGPGFGQNMGLKEDETGVWVEDVMSGTPAAKAGLKYEDIILSYDGRKVKTGTELQNLVAHTSPGTTVNLKVWRDNKEITIPVKVEKQPKNFFDREQQGRRSEQGQRQRGEEGEEETEETSIDTVGMTVEPLAETNAKRYGWEDDPEAEGLLLVTQVEPLGEAAALGISVGDLIVTVQGEKVKSVSDLRQQLNKDSLAKGVRIKIRNARRGYSTVFLQIAP